MYIEAANIRHLKTETLKKMGKSVLRAPDCEALSKVLENDYRLNVSPQSLRRFFGLIKYDGGFSSYTLDALARFCEFEDYADFKKNLVHNEIAAFFSGDKVQSDTDYWQLSCSLSQRIARSPSLLVRMHHELLSYPLAREYFIEHHPMRDMAATVYVQYFHEYLKYKNTNEAKLFAYGFLYMGAFLSENKELAEVYYQKVCDTPLTPEIYLLPAGRKFGVMLLHADRCGDERLFDETYRRMLRARERYRQASRGSACSFEYTVLEHLIFTDRIEEMRFLIENNTFQQHDDLAFIPESRKKSHQEIWKILCAFAYHKMGEKTSAQSYLAAARTEDINHGWQKYYTLLYLVVKRDYVAASERAAITSRLLMLINETHFSYLNAYAEPNRVCS